MKSYAQGKLALGGIDSRVPVATWLNALYAIVMDAPHEQLEKIHSKIVIESSRLNPDRETWGLLPEQVALSAPLTGQNRAPQVKR